MIKLLLFSLPPFRTLSGGPSALLRPGARYLGLRPRLVW